MADFIEGLSDIALFKLLTPAELQLVCEAIAEKKFRRGENVFEENQDGDTMYLINTGTVKITKRLQDKDVEVITLYAGDFFGEIALFERVGRTGTAHVLEDVSLIELSRDNFARLISRNPYVGIKILYRIIQDMAKRIQRMNVQNQSLFI
jgi:CRP/FNR family transcriptional regulator, cyclic AMP receptor protein